MRFFSALFLSLPVGLLAVALFPASARADGARAVCTGFSGLTVEVDFLKSSARFAFNGKESGWSEILEQEKNAGKWVFALGNPDRPAVLVMNPEVGSTSTLVMGDRQVSLVCR